MPTPQQALQCDETASPNGILAWLADAASASTEGIRPMEPTFEEAHDGSASFFTQLSHFWDRYDLPMVSMTLTALTLGFLVASLPTDLASGHGNVDGIRGALRLIVFISVVLSLTYSEFILAALLAVDCHFMQGRIAWPAGALALGVLVALAVLTQQRVLNRIPDALLLAVGGTLASAGGAVIGVAAQRWLGVGASEAEPLLGLVLDERPQTLADDFDLMSDDGCGSEPEDGGLLIKF